MHAECTLHTDPKPTCVMGTLLMYASTRKFPRTSFLLLARFVAEDRHTMGGKEKPGKKAGAQGEHIPEQIRRSFG